MLCFTKAKGRMLGLAVLIAQLLTAAVGTPSEFDDEALALLPRAPGGKYTGSLCSTNADCYSENCVATNGTTKLTCQPQPVGGPCFTAANCISRNCNKTAGKCVAPSNVQGICDSTADCNLRDYNLTCIKKTCRFNYGHTCVSDAECNYGACINRVCRIPQAPNAPCLRGAQCRSGRCTTDFGSCTNPDGSFTSCKSNSLTNCNRYRLGHACANDGQCDDGVCRNGICTASQIGDDCVEQYQCTGKSACGPDKKCYLPADGTVLPQDVCNSNGECLSGRCTTTPPIRDENGLTVESFDTPVSRTPICDFLNNGQSGCRSYRDCTTGLCQQGTCVLGKDGDRCIVNYQCEHLCGTDGLCFSLATQGDQGKGQICKVNDDCLSEDCVQRQFAPGVITRPSLEDAGNITIHDTSCDASLLGQACHSTDDCSAGICSAGVCKRVPLGGSCTTWSQCSPARCESNSVPTRGTCVLLGANEVCESNADCFSGSCQQLQGYIRCKSVAAYGNCRYNPDCATTCESGKCLAACSMDKDCIFSHSCVNNRCAAVTTTTATATITSSTSTRIAAVTTSA